MKMYRLALTASVCVFVLSAPAGEKADVRNPGFEEGAADGSAPGWILHDSQWRVEKGAGIGGSSALVFDGAVTNRCRWAYQWIKLKPHRRYRISAWERLDTLKCPKQFKKDGFTVYMEWFNSSNKIIGASMGWTYGKSRDGWRERYAVTDKVRPDIAKCRVAAIVGREGIGRARIDDILVEELEEPAVQGVWSSEYRDEAVEGNVSFTAAFNIYPDSTNSDLHAVFSYVDVAGRRVEERLELDGMESARLSLDVSRMAMGTNDVRCALRAGGKTMGEASVAFARLREPIPRKCRFDRFGRFYVDGKPFMPVGIYCLEADAANLDVIAKSPFNCVMPYRHAHADEDLDLCEKRGLKMIYDVRKNLQERFDDKIGRDWMKEVVPRVAKHPAVIAWYSDDESPITLIPRLKGRKRLMDELDKDHPVWAVQDKWKQVRFYLDTFDVFGTDIYPVSRDPVERVTQAMRRVARDTFGLRPVWQVPQGFRWDEGHRLNERMPTADEFANMTWQTIANGANGIVIFRYMQLREDERRPEWRRDAWPALCAAAAEVRRYEKVIMSGGRGPEVSGAPDAVAVRTWGDVGDAHVLCVNSTTNAVRCDVRCDAFAVGGTKVEFARAAEARCGKGGVLSLDLRPLGYIAVHALK